MPLKLPEVESVPYPVRFFVKGAVVLLVISLVIGTASYIAQTYEQLLKDLFVALVVVLFTIFVGWLTEQA